MAPSALAPHRRCTLPRPSSSARATHPPQPAGQCSIQHRHAVRASAVLAPLPADDRAFPSISGRLLVIGLTHDEDGPAPREALLGAQGEQHQQQDLQAPVSAAAPPSHLDDGLAAQQDGATGETPLALHAAASPSPSSGSRWPPPKPGDEVVGTVVFTNSKGCMVRLRGGQFVGHMPASQGPMLLPAQHQHQHHHHHHQHAIDPPPAAAGVQGESSPDSAEQGAHKAAPKERYPGVLPLGVSRRFVVMSMPTDGRGPLLSAALADQRVIMARAQQLKEMLWQAQRPLKARVAAVSAAGCHCEVPGLCGPHAFLPWKLVPDSLHRAAPPPPPPQQAAGQLALEPPHGQPQQQPEQQQPEQQHPLCVGDEVDVLLHTVDEAGAKIILTARDVQPTALQAGHLVTGHVHEVHAWGVSVALRGVHGHPEASAQLQGHEALLHHQRITRLHSKPPPQDVFQPGDPVTARVVYVGQCADHRGAAAAWRAGGLQGAASREADHQHNHHHHHHHQHRHYLHLPRRLQVELSLMELEAQDGDMLNPEARQACFAAALA